MFSERDDCVANGADKCFPCSCSLNIENRSLTLQLLQGKEEKAGINVCVRLHFKIFTALDYFWSFLLLFETSHENVYVTEVIKSYFQRSHGQVKTII